MTSPLPTAADPNPVGMWPTPHEIQHILNIPLTALNTFLLIVSSVSVVMGLDAIQKGNKKALTPAFLEARREFDPYGLMNPGKLAGISQNPVIS